jgi:hypothetical protein
MLVAGTGGTALAASSGVPGDASTPAGFALTSVDPSFGATIAFSATYAPMKWLAEESVECTQSGQMVYLDVQMAPDGASPWASSFTLWSQSWAGAGGTPADCTANLYYYTWKGHTETGVVYLGSSSFTTT